MLLADELRTLGLSEKLVNEVVTFLDGRAGDLTEARPQGVGKGAFGASPASTGCSGDAAKAHDRVHGAITEMVAGLRGYQASIKDMSNRVFDVDAAADAEIQTRIRQAEACVTPTFASPSQCTIPTSGTGPSGGQG